MVDTYIINAPLQWYSFQSILWKRKLICYLVLIVKTVNMSQHEGSKQLMKLFSNRQANEKKTKNKNKNKNKTETKKKKIKKNTFNIE